VIDDELLTAVEEGFESLLAVRTVEDVVLLDLHHGKPASLGVYAIAVPGQLLFMRQKFFPLGEPLVLRNDLRMWDCARCHLWSFL
jgi:hypothetical protein